MDIVVLDLDQTVISSEILKKSYAEEGDKVYDIESNREKSKHFEYQNMEGMYVIFERPHLQEFMDFLFANFRVGVWTAASQDYANFIVKNILIKNKKERKLDFFMCSYHGEKSSAMYKGPKDLDMIVELYQNNCSKRNILIVDDYIEVYKVQPRNCIIAKEFYYFNEDSENDDFLLNVMDKLKEYLKKKSEDGGRSQYLLNETIEKINGK